ncbi:MAG: DUF302 domain-containing protein [Synergistaceae bacterium]
MTKKIIEIQSLLTPEEVSKKLENDLATRNIPIFAKFDHKKNADEVSLSLDFNTVYVFGSPIVGTKLMQENPAISIALPLKISVWQNRDGNTTLSYQNIHDLAEEFNIKNNQVTDKIALLLENIINTITK